MSGEKNPTHIIIKTLSTQNKERIVKAAKEKRQTHYNNSRFLNSNSKCKKVMERQNSEPERKQLSTWTSLSK
jgi:hypothetical protein